MNFLTTALAFVVCLGSLVIFHELGHYLVARWCGVKVLRFSVGMGKVVWSRRFGADQTEWAVSALPLGGYVKMLDAREGDLGDLPESDLRREFTRQNVWKRIAIVAAGPLANFLIAILIYAGLFMHGVEEPSSKISVRAVAGALTDTAASIAATSRAPDAIDSGSAAAAPTAAWLAGLRSGDTISAINGAAVAAWSDVRWHVVRAAVDKVEARVAVERPGQGRLNFTLPANALSNLNLEGDVLTALGIGVARPAPTVEQMVPGSPAERAGLQVGDLLLAVGDTPVDNGIDFIDIIRASAGKAVQLHVRRAGAPLALDVTPEAEQAKTGKGTVTVGKIGAYVALQPDMINVPSSPIAAVGKAVVRVWDTCTLSLKMIGKMLTGEASLKNVTGPITIADYAGQSARMGAVSYLSFIAFISISLGVMNLLPIPVLDGGHLLYYSLEVLTGRSVPERFGEIAQRFGMGLLLTLMLLAVFNDVARLL